MGFSRERFRRWAAVAVFWAAAASSGAVGAAEPEDTSAELARQAKAIFGVLPSEAVDPRRPVTEARIALGRKLYFDPRLSKNHDVSCNSCHPLDRFGADGEATSPGHGGQRGGRSSPSTFNAALHIAQFWDGRAADVEEQAKGPILNPIEMAMPSEDAVMTVVRSIPGYPPLFEAAFPGETDPVSYHNLALAIGAFERRLITPGRFDRFMEGDLSALTPAEQGGLETFIGVGCTTCHYGPAVGGAVYQKLGLIEAYPTEDTGRFAVTGVERDRMVFKVPSLRNIAETGPYLHDGSVPKLEEMVLLMGRHQLGRPLLPDQVKSVVVFLDALTGEVDAVYTAEPELPPSGPDTPKPDPS